VKRFDIEQLVKKSEHYSGEWWHSGAYRRKWLANRSICSHESALTTTPCCRKISEYNSWRSKLHYFCVVQRKIPKPNVSANINFWFLLFVERSPFIAKNQPRSYHGKYFPY